MGSGVEIKRKKKRKRLLQEKNITQPLSPRQGKNLITFNRVVLYKGIFSGHPLGNLYLFPRGLTAEKNYIDPL